MESKTIQVICQNCNEGFSFQTDNKPFQSTLEPSANMKITEYRTYAATCPACQEVNKVVWPITKSLVDVEGLQGNMKTVNVKGGPACLVMLGIFILIFGVLGVIGYFLIEGIGVFFSWF